MGNENKDYNINNKITRNKIIRVRVETKRCQIFPCFFYININIFLEYFTWRTFHSFFRLILSTLNIKIILSCKNKLKITYDIPIAPKY